MRSRTSVCAQGRAVMQIRSTSGRKATWCARLNAAHDRSQDLEALGPTTEQLPTGDLCCQGRWPMTCPWRARSGGDQRGITVAHGHATPALTCGGPGQATRSAIFASKWSACGDSSIPSQPDSQHDRSTPAKRDDGRRPAVPPVRDEEASQGCAAPSRRTVPPYRRISGRVPTARRIRCPPGRQARSTRPSARPGRR
jgi:hypothetical protein